MSSRQFNLHAKRSMKKAEPRHCKGKSFGKRVEKMVTVYCLNMEIRLLFTSLSEFFLMTLIFTEACYGIFLTSETVSQSATFNVLLQSSYSLTLVLNFF